MLCPSCEIAWRSKVEYSTDERRSLEVFAPEIVFNSRHMVDLNVSEEDIREGGVRHSLRRTYLVHHPSYVLWCAGKVHSSKQRTSCRLQEQISGTSRDALKALRQLLQVSSYLTYGVRGASLTKTWSRLISPGAGHGEYPRQDILTITSTISVERSRCRWASPQFVSWQSLPFMRIDV